MRFSWEGQVQINRRGFGLGVAAFGSAWLSTAKAASSFSTDALGEQISTAMAANHVPGLGFGLVRSGRIVGILGFGLADLERGRRVTPDTVFHLASVSKVVTGAAAMQLWEQGQFQLDAPIAPHLDFPVINPRHAEPITFRQLFTHTSSISDNNYRHFQVTGDPVLGLRDFLVGYLAPGGKWFTPEGSFSDAAPGARYAYSNVATSLAGYLAERIGAAPLTVQTRDRIFHPLSMGPAAWRLADLSHADLATPYDEKDGKLSPIDPIGYPDWPAGLLRASTRAMTRFVAAHACGGQLGGARLLKPETVRAMVAFTAPPPLPNAVIDGQGLFWEELHASRPGIACKFGGDPGAHTLIAFDPGKAHGVVLLANRTPTKAWREVEMKLVAAALA
jgi:CubicO group peptidase (beta-lactamase class C family)